jgi:AcrR family transcriptional regulator
VKVTHVFAIVNAVPDDRPIRRRPEQARSRERVDAILNATIELISAQGTEPPSMTDIAERAGMGLTALYRYYPNKQSILRDLSLNVLDLNQRMFVAPLVEAGAPIEELVRDTIRAYWHLHRDEPFRLRLRVVIQGDAELSALDLADSRHNAHAFAGLVAQLGLEGDPAEVERGVFLIISLLDSLMLTAIQLTPAEAETMVDDFTSMAIALLNGLSGRTA